MGGVFFAFSTFVLKALDQLPHEQGIAAMQRINVVVLTPAFLGVFLGTALVAGAAGMSAVLSGEGARSGWMLAASVFYIVGCFGVTAAFNVPRNDRLARLQANSEEASTSWPIYVRE